MIQEQYGHNEMFCPSQSFGLTKNLHEVGFWKALSCKWRTTYTLVVGILWV